MNTAAGAIRRFPVRFLEHAALDEALDHQAAIARRVGRIGDLFATKHGQRIVPERHRARRQADRAAEWRASASVGTVSANARMSLGFLLPPAFARLTSFFWCLANTPHENVEHGAGHHLGQRVRLERARASDFIVFLFRPLRR